MKAPKPKESQLHSTVAKFLDWALLPPAFYTTFPSGWGRMTRTTAGRLKGCGLKPGMPDILVFHAKRVIGLELKTKSGLSRPQREVELLFVQNQMAYCVCHSIEDVIVALTSRGYPLRRLTMNEEPHESHAAECRPTRDSILG